MSLSGARAYREAELEAKKPEEARVALTLRPSFVLIG